MDSNRYDAIVIGGGHNGLIAGAYLSKNGARTVVLEARHKTGGAADTMSPWPEAPDIKVTTLSYVMSLMPPTIQKDLQLQRFGYDASSGQVVVTYDGSLSTAGGSRVETRRFTATAPSDGTAASVGPALNRAANQVALDVAKWIGG